MTIAEELIARLERCEVLDEADDFNAIIGDAMLQYAERKLPPAEYKKVTQAAEGHLRRGGAALKAAK